MKNFLTVLAVVVSISCASASTPNAPEGVSVVKKNDVVKLYYRGSTACKVKVSIYNERGTEVFSEIMRNTEHFMRPYNFSALPQGKYKIVLEAGETSESRIVEHRTISKERIAHLSKISGENGGYVLSVPNAGQDELTVRIYDEANHVLYQGKENINGDYAKLFKLKGIAGTPTFVISDSAGNRNTLKK